LRSVEDLMLIGGRLEGRSERAAERQGRWLGFPGGDLWATLAILPIDASIAGATGVPEKSVPQGQDPPGADNGEQQTPCVT
jgi:hypothetical protein